MRRCILHVGMHKTGSSSIQQSLFHHLRDDAHVYARLGKQPNHSVAMNIAFAAEPQNYHASRTRGLGEEDLARIRSETRLQLSGYVTGVGPDLIISGEDLCALDAAELEELREFLAPGFGRIVVAGYVRAPKSFMESAFQQRAKWERLRALKPRGLYPRYVQRLAKFDEVFGRDNVQLWPYERSSFPDGCVVRDFCARLRIRAPEQVIRANESLSLDALSLLVAYQQLRNEGPIVGRNAILRNNDLLAECGKVRGSPLRFSAALVRDVLAENAADLEWIERRLGVPLREPLDEAGGEGVSSLDELVCRGRALALELGEKLGPLLSQADWGGAPALAQADAPNGVAVRDLVAKIQAQAPGLFAGISPAAARCLVREALAEVRLAVAAAKQGIVEVDALGSFQAKKVKAPPISEGASRTAVLFRPASARSRAPRE